MILKVQSITTLVLMFSCHEGYLSEYKNPYRKQILILKTHTQALVLTSTDNNIDPGSNTWSFTPSSA